MQNKIVVAFFLGACLCGGMWSPHLSAQNGGQSTLRVTEAFIPRDFDILKSNTTETVRLGGLFFAKLYGFNTQGRIVAIAAQNELARGQGGQQTSFKVQLKPNLRWLGTTTSFGARDVKFTYDKLREKTSPTHWSHQIIKAVNVLSDLSVEFVFSQSIYFDLMQDIFTIPIYPFNYAGRAEADYFDTPNGLGPFSIMTPREVDVINLARNSSYTLGNPPIAGVQVRRIPNKDQQFAEIAAKTIDVVPDLPPVYAVQVDQNPQLVLKPYNLPEYNYFAYNMRKANLSDVRVRQAFTLLADRQRLLSTIYTGASSGEVITGPLTPDSPFYNSALQALTFDAQTAGRLLQDAKAEGKFDFNEVLTFKVPITGEQSTEALCLLFRQRLREVGVQVGEIQFMDFYAWRKAIFYDHEFDITYGVWTYGESVNLRALFHSDEAESGGLNFAGYSNPALDALLDAVYSGAQKEPEIIREMFHNAHKMIYDDCPYTFLFKLVKFAAHHQRAKKVNILPSNFYQYIHEWYLSE